MIIGLTGKSCSGKNYIGSLLSAKGFTVWDLDRLAEKIRNKEKETIKRIFGTTDRKQLSKIVFNNPEMLRKLEAIIYPKMEEKIKSFKYDLVLNGATLKRADFDSLCSFIIYIDAPYNLRLERAVLRDGITEEEFARREENQKDTDPEDVKYLCPVYRIQNTQTGNLSKDLDLILQKI